MIRVGESTAQKLAAVMAGGVGGVVSFGEIGGGAGGFDG
jgi:hypothetical protein